MLISYIQSIMMIILEVICCKIFFESFAEKRSKNSLRNYICLFDYLFISS